MQWSETSSGYYVQACKAIILISVVLLLTINVNGLNCTTGCNYKGKCIDVGEQRLEAVGSNMKVYCSQDGVIQNAKAKTEECQFNYECEAYVCEGGTCGKAAASSDEPSTPWLMIVLIIIIIPIILFLLLKSGLIKLKKEEEPVKKEEDEFVPPQIAAYKKKAGPEKFRDQLKTLKGKKKQ